MELVIYNCMSLLIQLQSKSEQEKTALAGMLAVGVMVLLFILWGLIVFARSDTAPTTDAAPAAQAQEAAAAHALTKSDEEVVNELIETLRAEGKLNPEDAAANFVRLYLDDRGGVEAQHITQ